MAASTASTNPTSSSGVLPPGVVLGPDGKPCKICTSSREWKLMTKMKKHSSQSAAGPSSLSSSSAPSTATAGAAGASAVGAVAAVMSQGLPAPTNPKPECPPDVEALGRATWTFLHTTAAYYPERPSMAQRVHMLGLLNALPSLYPCSYCASHLADNVKEHPPDVSGRTALSRWLCERHNDVNERLGKTKFDCSLKNLDERWKDGPSSGICDE